MYKYTIKIDKWLEVNELSLNVGETAFITYDIYVDSVSPQINIMIKDRNIARVEKCKYLGIVFDFNL